MFTFYIRRDHSFVYESGRINNSFADDKFCFRMDKNIWLCLHWNLRSLLYTDNIDQYVLVERMILSVKTCIFLTKIFFH